MQHRRRRLGESLGKILLGQLLKQLLDFLRGQDPRFLGLRPLGVGLFPRPVRIRIQRERPLGQAGVGQRLLGDSLGLLGGRLRLLGGRLRFLGGRLRFLGGRPRLSGGTLLGDGLPGRHS